MADEGSSRIEPLHNQRVFLFRHRDISIMKLIFISQLYFKSLTSIPFIFHLNIYLIILTLATNSVLPSAASRSKSPPVNSKRYRMPGEWLNFPPLCMCLQPSLLVHFLAVWIFAIEYFLICGEKMQYID